MNVTTEQIQYAKGVSLYDFLLEHYPNEYKAEAKSLVRVGNRSLHISRQPFGKSKLQYTDFNGTDRGDAIDFLQKYHRDDFKDFSSAVMALCGEKQVKPKVRPAPPKSNFFLLGSLPHFARNNRGAVEYLARRGISENTIKMLSEENYFYQCKALPEYADRERIVFLNREKNYFEVREISGEKFATHRDASDQHNSMWYFNKPCNYHLSKVFVSESALDAISCYELFGEDAFYVSIGGVCNTQRIQRLIDLGYEVILAVDNDDAGEKCRDKFKNCKAVVPKLKDFNADLCKRNMW